MAKEKKRGFFSWLGFGQKEQDQVVESEEKIEEQSTVDESAVVADTPVVEETPANVESETIAEETPAPHTVDESEVFAADVVEVTEQVAQSEALQPVAEDATPVLVEELPVVEDNVPTAVEEPLVAEDVAPVLVEELPVVEDNAPAAVEEPTVAEDVAPVLVEELPVVEDNALAAVEEPPVAEDVTPVLVEELPVVETVAPEEIAEAELTDEELEAQALEAQPQAETVEEESVAQQQEQEKPTKEGFFARLKRSLLKTKENLGSGFISLFRGKKIDDDLFEELEEQLLIADVGVDTTRKIIASLTETASRKQLHDAEALYGLLKDEMGEILAKVDEPLNIEGKTPFVILMVGVNGVGKTTTIGKLARQFEQQGKTVMLAAGDTFRAAAVEQLQVWGERNNIPVIAQHTGADSASVIFDAIQAAKARNVDVLIADTAGRLQNKSHLMEELKKIVRVMKKLDVDAPHEVMLTLDASTGQNAISQAKLFHEAVGLTGITLTKLDGTAKGGVIFSVADQFGIPIRYIGVGERIEDLRPFKAGDFIEALFARED
ncbi:signal recognition particle-docking protein FtsY [Kluyvera intermedia]|uniref:Signal recognition particle receptor FtsY n=1 Tax=Kluyvera intermedia TaxID=61648 RepID=A0ABX6DMM5_KLUIN|nr:signal recognition particle-docking protein FtsY [Kluyvera intermedia]QGH28421.1 signal recognition particle-docking protein FtsY [Kluyvera intermedia]QGH37403.1 signal recognition particle-docking protein FtsY [Kluyvera intermedia]